MSPFTHIGALLATTGWLDEERSQRWKHEHSGPRKPSGKDRSKIKKARKQKHRRKP